MKINTISKILIVFLLTSLVVSCVKDTDYELPDTTISVPKFEGTIKSVEEVISATTEEVTDYQDNDALEGYVISSDEGGNFYKKIYVESADKKHGFTVALDKGGLYSEFPFGTKIQVRLQGLSVQLVNGKLEIGYKTYTSKRGTVSVGTAPAAIYKDHIYKLQQEALHTKESLAKKSSSIKDLKVQDNVNLLLTFENVYFEEKAIGKTFHVKENDRYAGTNYNLIDTEGNKVPFRTSKFAKFKDEKVPVGLLNITGVLTTYNGSYQFLINNIEDISVVGEAPNTGDNNDADGGNTGGDTNTVLTVPVIENFEEGLPAIWKTISVKGKRVWEKKDFGKKNYIQMSAYSKSGALDVETWLITPKINLGEHGNNILKIKLADAFQNGNPLHIMYSSDYDGENNLKTSTWNEIGEEAVKALINNSGKYDNKYEESKAIKIPTKGEVYIAFVYNSKGTVSTTIQLENVSITKGDATDDNTTPPSNETEIKSIADIREIFKGDAFTISENYTIEGVVISDRANGNTNGKNLVIQGEKAGITLRFKANHNVDLGQKIKVSVKGAELSEYKGLLQIGNLETTAILVNEKSSLPTPKVVSIKDVLAGKYQSEWIKIEDVQFKDNTKTYSENILVTNCTDELPVFVNSKANFASEQVSKKRGSITGYISKFNNPQLIINDVSGVSFTEDYKDCSGGSNEGSDDNNDTTDGDNSGDKDNTNEPGNDNSIKGSTFKFDFENIQGASSTSYDVTKTISASDNKTTLVFKGRTDMNKYAINGKGVMMKDKGYIKITFPRGVKTLKFKYRAAYTSGTKRKIFVVEGDENSEIPLKEVKFDKDVISETFTLELNKTGSYTLTIKAGTKQVVIDDIEWTE